MNSESEEEEETPGFNFHDQTGPHKETTETESIKPYEPMSGSSETPRSETPPMPHEAPVPDAPPTP